jgi:hypothetical protein
VSGSTETEGFFIALMPNRILRDWTDSSPINKLLWQEEVLFTRLIMKADDFGNFYRNCSLVKSLLFPMKDDLRTSDIDRWLKNLEVAGLIQCYPAKGDLFLHIVNFGQRLDRTSRKFPKEPDNISDDNHPPQSAADSLNPPPETKRNEVETEREPRAREPDFFLVERVFKQQGGTDEMAKSFFNKHDSTNWHLNGSKIMNWQSLVGNYITIWKQNEVKRNGHFAPPKPFERRKL